jgi:heat shock protein HslJ
VEGRPSFTTDRHYPVLTDGTGTEVELLLRRVAASGGATGSLENTYWKLTRLGEAPVTVPSGRQEAHLIFNSLTGRVTGSGGCNRLTGSYEVNGDRLSLGEVAGTMMACMEGMEQEQAFLKSLGAVSGWGITGQQLELRDAVGAVVARFEARHME